jgi:transcriptional regulator with XRE-family HTH domain
MLNISNTVNLSQKQYFLTPRQCLSSIAPVGTRRIITAADLAAAGQLRALWAIYKDKTGDTQERAGARIGLSQAAFSQYLKATIALNTEAALKFAQLFGVHPREIRPDIDLLLRNVEVQTLSREAANIAKAIDALPPEPRVEILDYILYKIETTGEHVASDKRAHYTALMKEFRRDLADRKKEGRRTRSR